MTDYAEDQEMEVEALQSILMDDMAVVTGSEAIDGASHAPCYQISVSPLGDGEETDPDGDESQTARLGLVFSHTPTYPDTPPLIKCRSLKGLFDSELAACRTMLTKMAEESVGTVMIFDLVQAAKEWMRDRAGVVDVVEETPEQITARLEEEAERRLKAMRATGTPVTKDSYREWTERFDAERALKRLKADPGGAEEGADGEKKMTGRRYFEERTAAQLEADEGEGLEGDGDEDDFDFGDSDFDDSDDELLEFMKGGGDGDDEDGSDEGAGEGEDGDGE